ncbi:MAG: hypothetical protein DWI25_07805 [Planctomycetota bacterium]|nr:MAG: hypothetical protein DWI25_07805 [Planctomycetota bacterium]
MACFCIDPTALPRRFFLTLACLSAVIRPAISAEVPPQTMAEAISICRELSRASGPDGQADMAAKADQIAELPAEWLAPCLVAFDDATPAGANWLRSGLDRAADRFGDRLPLEELATLVGDATQSPRGRSLAFLWLTGQDRAKADGLLDTLLDDPSLDLRRQAVEKLLASAGGQEQAAHKKTYRRGLAAARDIDQIEQIVGWLAEHGEQVDVAEVLGFVRQWRVSEAFDNAKGIGFEKIYPPQTGELAQPDTSGWKAVASTDKHGAIDLNAALETKKGVLAYAVAIIEMPRAGAAQVRIGSPCAVAVWVNGLPVMAHEIYHASEAIDQYIATTDFSAGTNSVMVKCCQNEQTEPWAVDWKFQLRICDSLGLPLATQLKRAGDE